MKNATFRTKKIIKRVKQSNMKYETFKFKTQRTVLEVYNRYMITAIRVFCFSYIVLFTS